MKLKSEKVQELMQQHAKGNYNEFARQLDVDPSHLWRSLNGKSGCGKKIIGAVMKFCTTKKLDYTKYIEL